VYYSQEWGGLELKDGNTNVMFIPTNDDSVSGLKLILNSFSNSILQGQQKFQENQLVRNSKQLSKQPNRTNRRKGKI
jgi:ribosomal protein S2